MPKCIYISHLAAKESRKCIFHIKKKEKEKINLKLTGFITKRMKEKLDNRGHQNVPDTRV